MSMAINIDKEVKVIINKLKKQGFDAYIVGGCVRDFLLNKKPKDWDITTNALPKQIQQIFPKSYYNNKFGTVRVKDIEITTYRADEKYSDKRHPDKVKFGVNLKEDLARRDFTINAMAMDSEGKIIDPFNGQEDLKKKIIRAVGKPEQRFSEDALRLMRAVRLSTELDFKIEEKTLRAIEKNSAGLKMVSKERIRDELIKIIEAKKPEQGILLLKETGLLSWVIPELEKGVGISQNRHHIYTIFKHSILSLEHCPSKKLSVRLAALFHDIAKPEAKRGQGPEATFYLHDQLGAKKTIEILQRLKFPKDIIEKTALLVRHHMFLSDPEKVTETGARRLLRRVGKENIKDLIDLRIADRLGSGVPKARPYRLRKFEYMLDKVSRDPISTKMLKIDGDDVMKILDTRPGPRVGLILEALLSEILEQPKKNTKKHLTDRVKELNKLSDKELKEKIKVVVEKKEEVELAEKRKFFVS